VQVKAVCFASGYIARGLEESNFCTSDRIKASKTKVRAARHVFSI
jgi:hypothetical protein